MKKVRITVLLVVLLLPLCGALGQSLVSEVQNTDSDTSIVRYWNSSISVVYSHRERFRLVSAGGQFVAGGAEDTSAG